MVSSSLGSSTYEENARTKSINVGLDHATNLLGELHENECDSSPCDGRASEHKTSNHILPPPTMEQDPPIKPRPRSWSAQEDPIDGSSNSRHCDKRTNVASPGKAKNGKLGSRHRDTCTDDASPGKATNSTSGGSHCDSTHPQRSTKRHKIAYESSGDSSLDQVAAADQLRVWPKNMMSIIKSIVESHSPCPEKPLFEFEMTSEAAEKNFLVLKRFNFDVKAALAAQAKSPMGYGSEFRKRDILSPLVQHHPLWPRLEKILKHGSQWPTSPISEEDRLADLFEALEFGNHKGASTQPDLLLKLVSGDVTHGYALPLPLDKITRIPGICMAPLNIQPQWTINERGEIVAKDRLTHDQSFVWTKSGTSVNSRIDTDLLQQCKFGKCLVRLINWTVAARRKYPNRRILAKKDDIKSAYRRMHLSWDTAIKTVTQIPQLLLALMMLRLSFGGAPGPFEFSVASELLCDLIIAIMHNKDWNPYELHGKNQHLVPPPELLDDSIPFAKGLELIVDIPIDPIGTTDVYIDDLVSLTVDVKGTDNLVRCDRAPLLGIDTLSRPLDLNEPMPRETMEAMKKLEAEALLQEIKTILGWEIDFRRLLIKLPDNKFVAWAAAIEQMLSDGMVTAKVLETNIGRLVHLGLAIPLIHHFMSRLRDLHSRSKKRRSVKINKECREDLDMMLGFLKIAHEGISLNSIAFRKPTHIYRSDSCPNGLGGYSHEGWAWRWYLPKNLRFRASNNLLEHLAAVISPWVDILAGRLNNQDCVLSMTDSTTAEGWLRKSNFTELNECPTQASVRIEAARKFATLMMESGIRSYSQWFKGIENEVSDALSRDDDRTDEELTHVIKSFCPSQVPSHFEIRPLPNEITSWLTALLLKLPVNERYNEVHTRSKIGRGGDGKSTWNPSESRATNSSKTSPENSDTRSSERLPWLSEKPDFRDQLMTPWLQAQSAVPSSVYVRPSEKTVTQTRLSTKTASLHSFYSENLGRSKISTHQRNTKQQSPCLSCPPSTNETPRNSNAQPPNLSHLESSSQCDPVSISRYTNLSSEEPTSSGFGTSGFSAVANNSTTTTSN